MEGRALTPSRWSESDSAGDRPDAIARRPLVWLNLVCLDAPLVAITWQWLFARDCHVGVSLADLAALFLSSWLIYLSDRLFDSMSCAVGAAKSLREQFCLEHRNTWVGSILIVALLDGVIIWRFIDSATFRFGVVLASIVVVYLAINVAFSRSWRTIPIKEITVGSLFAAGTLLALVPLLPSPSPGFACAALLFACLCSLNCMSIALWEQHLDRSRGRHSIATNCPGLKRAVVSSLIVLGMVSAALPLYEKRLWSLSVCLGVSFALLAILHFWKTAALDEKTALADLALLTPCCYVFLEKAL